MKKNLFLLLLFLIFSCNKQDKQRDVNEEIDNLINTADSLYKISKKDSCIILSKTALDLSKEVNYLKGEVDAMIQIARVRYDSKDMQGSKKYIEESYFISDSINYYEGKVRSLGSLAKILHQSGDKKTALVHVRQAYTLSLEKKDSLRVPVYLEHISTIYRDLGKNDSSLFYVLESLKYCKKTKNLRSESFAYNNLGIYHFNVNKNPDSSIYYFHKSRRLRESDKNLRDLVQTNNNLGYIFSQIGEIDSAIFYLKSSIKTAKEQMAVTYINQTYNNLIETYENIGDLESALTTSKEHLNLNDSINKINAAKELENAIEHEKLIQAKKENKELKNDNLKTFILVLILLGIMLFATFITLLSNRRKKLANSERIKRLAAKTIMDEYEKIDEWIAQELHDNIGGSIAAIRLRMLETLDVIREKVEKDKKENKETFEMNLNKLNHLITTRSQEIELLDEVYKNIRNLSHNLAPVSFVGGKFVSLLQEKISSRFPKSIRHSIVIEPEEELIQITDDLKFNVYRILQNLSSNIVRHSKAKNSKIKVLGGGNHLTILVEDDGIGFDPKTKHGLGLDLVQKRVLLFDGTIDIDSQINKGTTITIIIPYQKNRIIE